MRAFLIEDDPAFSAEVSAYLGRHDITVMPFHSMAAFQAFVSVDGADQADLLLLDLGLPDGNGLEFLAHWRRETNFPCIVLSGNDNDMARVLALDLGADDFIVKTASPREILARIHAVLRRVNQPVSGQPGVVATREWRLVPARRDLMAPDQHLAGLTASEYDLLNLLMQSPHEPVHREVLSRAVLRRDTAPGDRALDNLISRLRRKIAARGGPSSAIRAVRQVGYVFTSLSP